MKDFFDRWMQKNPLAANRLQQDDLRRQVAALYNLYAHIIGPDKVVLKAGKMDALALIGSEDLGERVLGLERLVYEDPTLDHQPSGKEIPAVLERIENELADLLARRTMEDRIEKRVNELMEERHQEYVQEIRQQVIKDESRSESPQARKRLEDLEKMENRALGKSLMELLRPSSLGEIVGQDRGVAALRAKLASPYPQHLLLYGPPGVGKTTAARVVLEEAKQLRFTPFSPEAPFVEVDGTSLRWDPRDITNPLLGSVHDPIYQGARRELADGAIPEPKPGLVTDAHGGILFIDEIGEMDALLMSKLLKVLEDKRVIFDSAYYDAADPNIPAYIRKLFEEGAPADFILIGATTRDPEEIHPAIRSRCAEIFFEPLTPKHIEEIIRRAADKLDADMDDVVPALVSEYTIEGRKAVNILADAYGQALYRHAAEEAARVKITKEDVYNVVQTGRIAPYVNRKGSATAEVGRVFGLGVAGFLGSVLEIEAVSFPTAEKGKGSVRFNETAGSMAKDSVFNATAVVRKITGRDLADVDLHINVVGGGRIDGPSAGMAVTTAIVSALSGRAIRQDVAVTGEVSIQGKVKAVGGVFEKAYGAKQAGMRMMIIPKENAKDIPEGHLGLDIRPVDTVEEALELLLQTGNDQDA